jgi:hypothetical protein
MSGDRPNRLVRLLELFERMPFRHGEITYVTMDNQHPPITNRGEPGVPNADVPDAVRQDGVRNLRQRRAEEEAKGTLS